MGPALRLYATLAWLTVAASAAVCVGPLAFSLTLTAARDDPRPHRLGRCTFVPPGRLLGAAPGCAVPLAGARFAFQVTQGTRDAVPALHWWQEGRGRCTLATDGRIACASAAWRLDGLQPLEPVVWNQTGWFQGPLAWEGPPRDGAHGLVLGPHERLRPLFLDDERAPGCDVFFVFRPADVHAVAPWVRDSAGWSLTLPWERVFDLGCADWPPNGAPLPRIDYCLDGCASVPWYAPTPVCR